MKKLPKTTINRENARYRRQLADWLHEWRIDQSIRQAAVAGLPPDAAPRGFVVPEGRNSRNLSPAEGLVILLPPASATFAAERPLYVLVLKKISDAFMVAPFGRFATPATDREWKTGLRAKPLRVLCLWNARKISARALATGWFTARLSSHKHQQALTAYEQSSHPGGDSPTKAFGPPLRHPLDPRHEYLAEEAALMDEHLLELESQEQVPAVAFLYQQMSSPLLKAAEDRPDYGRRSTKPGSRKRKRM